MTISRADFLVEFAEFSGAATALVDAKLAAALLRTPDTIWLDLQDEGIKYLHYDSDEDGNDDEELGADV